MTFRRRLIVLSGVAVAVAVGAVSVATYILVRNELYDRVDEELQRDVSETFAGPLASLSDPPRVAGQLRTDRGHPALTPAETSKARRLFLPPGPLGGRSIYAQLVDSDGDVTPPHGPRTHIGSTAAATEVAAGDRAPFYSNVDVEGSTLRVYTAPIEHGQAIQVARTLDEVDNTLNDLAVILGIVSLGGIALAGALGYFVSRAAVSPVERLRQAAEQVATTRDFSRRIKAGEDDELAGLAESFNQMLIALEGSLDAQRQLVADASHELRTPLASLRTNIDVLTHAELLSKDAREELLGDVDSQLDELTELVGDLVDLARDTEHEREPATVVRYDLVVADAIDRAMGRNPSVNFNVDGSPCWVRAVESRLERAVSNLIDNAVKWSPPGGTVEISIHDGELSVRDHGPGISGDDLPHVFDRFYRSATARGLPGSGLGLAIVRQVAEQQGGSVSVANADGGGAVLVLSFPQVPAPAEPVAA